MAIGLDALMAVGDLRRYEPEVSSVALLGIAPDSQRRSVLTRFSKLPFVRQSEQTDDRSISVETDRGQLSLHVAPPDQAGAALISLTGSIAHVEWLENRAESL